MTPEHAPVWSPELWGGAGSTACGCRFVRSSWKSGFWLIPAGHGMHNGYLTEFQAGRYVFENLEDEKRFREVAEWRFHNNDLFGHPPLTPWRDLWRTLTRWLR